MLSAIFQQSMRRWSETSVIERLLFTVAVSISAAVSFFLIMAVSGMLGFLIIQSPSMEPYMPAGALAIFEPAAFEDIRDGDIIVFNDGQDSRTLITHRAIAKLTQDGKHLIKTKGDNNSRADFNFVSPEELKGRVRYNLPHAGRLLLFTRSPLGLIILIGMMTLFLMLMATDKIKARAIRSYQLQFGCEMPGAEPGRDLVQPGVALDSRKSSTCS